MNVTITAIYASLLAILYVWLAFRVIGYRQSAKVSLGDNNDPELRQRIRTHSNFAEYAPFGIALLLLLELQGLPVWLVHLSGLSLFAGRLAHAIGLQPHPMNFKLRKTGMLLTFGQLVGTALVLLATSIF